MMFGLFGSKKKRETVDDLLEGVITYQRLVGHIGKAQSLQKLNRGEEARQVWGDAERMVTTFFKEHPTDKNAHIMLALFYKEAGALERAEGVLANLLKSEFKFSEDERLIIGSELQKIERQRPRDQRAANGPKGYTQVYCCANCGRLHNFVSMPCPHCDWSPKTILEAAQSIVLSSAHLPVPSLLGLSREMEDGRSPEDVVPNLKIEAEKYTTIPAQRQVAEKVLSLLRDNEHKNHRSLPKLRECENCGTRIWFSGAETCDNCGGVVRWPGAVRALATMDGLLWLFEKRVELSSTEAFSEFVCLLVAMTNNLLRKQEVPTDQQRQYALKLLAEMGAVCDLNRGAVIDTKDPKKLMIYLVKDSMLEDTKTFGVFLYKELEVFVQTMESGVRH